MQIMLLRIWGKYIKVSQKTKHEADPEDKLIKKTHRNKNIITKKTCRAL